MAESVHNLVANYYPQFPRRHCRRLVTDTSNFAGIDYGDVIVLEGQHYLVLNNEAERKFGLEDPKFWVKRCRWLEGGDSRILKLVFHERFEERIGSVRVHSYRSGRKEARILDLVRGDPRFMQGVAARDSRGNIVRVLEIIRGRRLDEWVDAIEVTHKEYFTAYLPQLLEKFLGCCEAIAFLHGHGERHGDIRSDHIWVERRSDAYRWIDFDYDYAFHENPFGLDIFGLGNILLFLVGKGVYMANDLAPETRFTPDDFSLVFRTRLVNLGKLFPYIPSALNRILMRFSQASEVFYDSVEELMEDIRATPLYQGEEEPSG